MVFSVWQAALLGLVQGLTEILPVSSSAHLKILPWLLWNIDDIGAFDVALHAGTLLAIVIIFFHDWLNLLKGAYQSVVKKEKNFEGKMFLYLVIATIPGGIIGFLLDHYFEDLLNKPAVIACAMIVMGIIFYLVDKYSKSQIKYEDMSLKQTALIGLSQALAFIPGVSRSGITITTARAMGIERESAAKFSFLLSAPIVLGATILKIKDFAFTPAFFVGVIISFVVGLIVIKFLMNYLKKGSYKPFAIYRVIFGIIVLVKLFFFS
ncbi:MAG: undecaprenyl-diphosphatase UppP [Clostridia bacterium]|nr:undecaprenyl-diphosphatase UppP [Clostridia bacterium]